MQRWTPSNSTGAIPFANGKTVWDPSCFLLISCSSRCGTFRLVCPHSLVVTRSICLQDCAIKESQIERCKLEKKALEKELEKVLFKKRMLEIFFFFLKLLCLDFGKFLTFLCFVFISGDKVPGRARPWKDECPSPEVLKCREGKGWHEHHSAKCSKQSEKGWNWVSGSCWGVFNSIVTFCFERHDFKLAFALFSHLQQQWRVVTQPGGNTSSAQELGCSPERLWPYQGGAPPATTGELAAPQGDGWAAEKNLAYPKQDQKSGQFKFLRERSKTRKRKWDLTIGSLSQI